MIEENGEKWKKSRERRDLEKVEELEKRERLGRAAEKKKETMETIKKRKIQQKITEKLNILPENRRKIIERKELLQRNLMMAEAENELWRKWRRRKGRGMRNWKEIGENETLERKFEIVEEQVRKYKLELERIELRRSRRLDEEKKEMDNRKKRMEQKRRNEEHWEMLRWITKFMKENKSKWEIRRESEMERKRWEENKHGWEKMTEMEKIETLKNEEQKR